MYNEDLKKRFIEEKTKSESTKQYAYALFNSFESDERGWGADLCTRDTNDLESAVNKMVGLRRNSRWTTLSILKEYVRFCIDEQVPGACDAMLHVEVNNLEKVRTHMVSGPVHLQKYLDVVFETESKETIDNIYRCFYWLAFAGIYEDDAFKVTTKDVVLDLMTINYEGESFPIYREAIPAFKNAIDLEVFSFSHPKYTKDSHKDRAPGELLIRGTKSSTCQANMRSIISSKGKKAVDDGLTEQHLSYSRIWLSGLFYRTYENERAGSGVDFTKAAVRSMQGKTYKNDENQRKRIIHDYNDDYQRWKEVFSYLNAK